MAKRTSKGGTPKAPRRRRPAPGSAAPVVPEIGARTLRFLQPFQARATSIYGGSRAPLLAPATAPFPTAGPSLPLLHVSADLHADLLRRYSPSSIAPAASGDVPALRTYRDIFQLLGEMGVLLTARNRAMSARSGMQASDTQGVAAAALAGPIGSFAPPVASDTDGSAAAPSMLGIDLAAINALLRVRVPNEPPSGGHLASTGAGPLRARLANRGEMAARLTREATPLTALGRVFAADARGVSALFTEGEDAPVVPSFTALPEMYALAASLQRKAAGGPAPLGARVQAVQQASLSRGQALPLIIRRTMEGALGGDFGGVRVHTDGAAASAAAAVQAQAFALGSNLYFAPGAYNPNSPAGLALLGHELTHTLQWARTRQPASAGEQAPPSLEAEALAVESSILRMLGAPGRADMQGVTGDTRVPGGTGLAQRLIAVDPSIARYSAVAADGGSVQMPASRLQPPRLADGTRGSGSGLGLGALTAMGPLLRRAFAVTSGAAGTGGSQETSGVAREATVQLQPGAEAGLGMPATWPAPMAGASIGTMQTHGAAGGSWAGVSGDLVAGQLGSPARGAGASPAAGALAGIIHRWLWNGSGLVDAAPAPSARPTAAILPGLSAPSSGAGALLRLPGGVFSALGVLPPVLQRLRSSAFAQVARGPGERESEPAQPFAGGGAPSLSAPIGEGAVRASWSPMPPAGIAASGQVLSGPLAAGAVWEQPIWRTPASNATLAVPAPSTSKGRYALPIVAAELATTMNSPQRLALLGTGVAMRSGAADAELPGGDRPPAYGGGAGLTRVALGGGRLVPLLVQRSTYYAGSAGPGWPARPLGVAVFGAPEADTLSISGLASLPSSLAVGVVAGPGRVGGMQSDQAGEPRSLLPNAVLVAGGAALERFAWTERASGPRSGDAVARAVDRAVTPIDSAGVAVRRQAVSLLAQRAEMPPVGGFGTMVQRLPAPGVAAAMSGVPDDDPVWPSTSAAGRGYATATPLGAGRGLAPGSAAWTAGASFGGRRLLSLVVQRPPLLPSQGQPAWGAYPWGERSADISQSDLARMGMPATDLAQRTLEGLGSTASLPWTPPTGGSERHAPERAARTPAGDAVALEAAKRYPLAALAYSVGVEEPPSTAVQDGMTSAPGAAVGLAQRLLAQARAFAGGSGIGAWAASPLRRAVPALGESRTGAQASLGGGRLAPLLLLRAPVQGVSAGQGWAAPSSASSAHLTPNAWAAALVQNRGAQFDFPRPQSPYAAMRPQSQVETPQSQDRARQIMPPEKALATSVAASALTSVAGRSGAGAVADRWPAGSDSGTWLAGETALGRHLRARALAASRGQVLPLVVQRAMSTALGADFSAVRVHTDQAAAEAARALDARAFAHGRNLYFAPGAFDPGSPAGLALIGHELVHTLQGAGMVQRKALGGALPLVQAEPGHVEARAVGVETTYPLAYPGGTAPPLSRTLQGGMAPPFGTAGLAQRLPAQARTFAGSSAAGSGVVPPVVGNPMPVLGASSTAARASLGGGRLLSLVVQRTPTQGGLAGQGWTVARTDAGIRVAPEPWSLAQATHPAVQAGSGSGVSGMAASASASSMGRSGTEAVSRAPGGGFAWPRLGAAVVADGWRAGIGDTTELAGETALGRHLRASRALAASRGQVLPLVVQRAMSTALGADFSAVRVHTDQAAAEAARALDARAFAHGRNLYFAPGAFDPGSPAGLALIGHELVHTLQGAGMVQRKALAGALPLVQAEPGHLEAQAVGVETALHAAFSADAGRPTASGEVGSMAGGALGFGAGLTSGLARFVQRTLAGETLAAGDALGGAAGITSSDMPARDLRAEPGAGILRRSPDLALPRVSAFAARGGFAADGLPALVAARSADAMAGPAVMRALEGSWPVASSTSAEDGAQPPGWPSETGGDRVGGTLTSNGSAGAAAAASSAVIHRLADLHGASSGFAQTLISRAQANDAVGQGPLDGAADRVGMLASGVGGSLAGLAALGPTIQRDLVPPGSSPVSSGNGHVSGVDGTTGTTGASAHEGSHVPTGPDLDVLTEQVIARIKRELALDHDRAGGFLSNLMR